MNILKIINNLSKYYVHLDLGKTFDKYLNENKDEYYLVVPNRVLLDKWGIEKFLEKYHFVELFDISNFYCDAFNELYMFWHVSKKKTEKIKIACFFDGARLYTPNTNVGEIKLPQNINENFAIYLSYLNKWQNYEDIPNDNKFCEFILLNNRDFDVRRPFPYYYRKNNEEIRKLLLKEDMMTLEDVTKIYYVSAQNYGNDLTIVDTFPMDKIPNYPYNPKQVAVKGFISSLILHKGDIVKFKNDYFLLDKESDFDLYAPIGSIVIRPEKISSTFLYMYLNSRTSKKINLALCIQFQHKRNSNSLMGSLESFPVVKPKYNNYFYDEQFKRFVEENNTKGYNNNFTHYNNVENLVLNDCYVKIKGNNENIIENIVKKDILEIEICFDNKAYKSAVILSGALIEAYLFDWLCEIYNINNEDYKMQIYELNEKLGYSKNNNMNFEDYIKEIKKYYYPLWNDEAKKANEIRQFRNIVHFNRCLDKKEFLCEEKCKNIMKMVINIFESRLKIS